MTPAVTTPAQLDERYGRTPRGRLPWIVVGIVAAVVIGIAGWLTVRSSSDSVDITGTGYEVVDEHTVTVSFQITAPRDRTVHCIVEAQDEEFGIVGWRVVEYPASADHSRAFVETVPTLGLATTGLVNACWVA
ncbi:hypothetical protein J2Y69_000199 [Microbacterium resistens]|uniref:DUF4307 domain-containing protein n=1 Tax=Microbacterium resistens TaxID=156977 RepID=A0ABU1S7N5_9MICO|nr:DUF4307 domain-containing protein [Microbacterium resistens]MDR6865617.1 hypothetical protein [Microbacterium resistens]